MALLFSPLAALDLESIGDYIAQDNPTRALTFVEEIKAQCQKILRSPEGYRLRSDIQAGLRSCALGRYVIFFCVVSGDVLVVRVLHSAMDIPQHLD